MHPREIAGVLDEGLIAAWYPRPSRGKLVNYSLAEVWLVDRVTVFVARFSLD